MPKLKTNRSVKKRMRVTKTGRVKHFQGGKSHLLTLKSAKRKRLLSKPSYATKTEEKILKLLLPYGA